MSDDKKSIEEFKNEIELASWHMLEDHYKRGAVFIIDEKLSLPEVANAFARDYSSIVKIWLDEGQLKLVEQELKSKIVKDEHEKIVNFLIVQPYVIIQLLK